MILKKLGRGIHVLGQRIRHQGTHRARFAERELFEMQRRYRTLVEQLPLASYIEDLDAPSANYMSPQIADLVGYTGEEWSADPNFFAKVLHPDDRERVLSDFARMHQTGERFGCEYRLLARDGRDVWVHDAAVVVRDEQGRRLYVQGYMLDITERKANEAALSDSQGRLKGQLQRIEHQALHDSLTGLPNRTLVHDRLDQALARCHRDRSQVAVMLLDVDDFKLVNDSLGHAAGDELLIELAARLGSALRDGETVARLGGDEFVLVVEGIRNERDVVVVAERVQSLFAEPFGVGGSEQQMTGSLGVMVSAGEGSASDLLRDADVAMYRAKASQKGSFEFFDAAFRAALLRKVAVGASLKEALRDRTLEVYYQPIVSLVGGQMVAVEALVRWQDPQWGWVQPSEFIPIAEEDGTIVRLGQYVIHEAAGAAAEWRKQSPEALPLGVHINVSARELADSGFTAHVSAALAEHGLTSSDVAFEITERVFVDERQLTVSRNLEELGRLGMRLILDDFGTGYSALAYLARFPLAALKIDRFFIRSIRDPTDESPITKAVISLGKTLGMAVIAEGIETQVQLDYLRRLGCDAGQGFHFARPQPATDISAHLRDVFPLAVPTQVSLSASG